MNDTHYSKPDDPNAETSLRDYLRVLFRQKAVVVTAFVTVLVTVTLGLMLKTPVYEGHVKMLITAAKQVEAPYYRELIGSPNVGITITQAEIVKSDPVLTRAVQAVGLYDLPFDYEKRFSTPLKGLLVKIQAKSQSAQMERLTKEQQQGFKYRMAIDRLRESVTVEPIRDTNLFLIKVQDYSAYGAAVLANVVSRSYVIFDLEQQLAELQLKYGEKNPAVTQMKDNIAAMEKSLDGNPLPNIDAIGPASVKIVEQAEIPIRPIGVPKSIVFLLAFFMSIFLGVMLAFVFEYLDPTFKTLPEVTKELNLELVGSITRPKKKEALLIGAKPKKSTYAHFYQVLSDQIYLMVKDKKMKALLVTSSSFVEGVEEIVVNLGAFLCQKGSHHVLLVDGNLRHASLHKLLKTDNVLGFSHVLEGKCSLKEVTKDLGHGLHLVPAGVTELNPVILLDSAKVKDALEDAAKKYEVVLIVCPNLSSFKDAAVLAGYADGTIVVVSESVTRRQVLKIALAPLVEKKINIMGVILNNRTFPIPKFIYDRI